MKLLARKEDCPLFAAEHS